MIIAILGAGSVGTFVGGSLLAAGAEVVFIGRAKMRAQIKQYGIVLTDLSLRRQSLRPAQVHYTEEYKALATADLILVTVKSAATPVVATEIAAHARPDALIISLQNGIGNADVLRTALPGRKILGGMVPFNVLQMAAGRLHRGSMGEITIEASGALAKWLPIFKSAHLPLQSHREFTALQWGKLLLNLNNPINALADVPLKVELSQRAYRQCLALLIDEALGILKQAQIRPAKVVALPCHWLPFLFRLPDPVFKIIASSMLKIDAEARSSMWEDLQAGRRTEIDYINGAVVALATQHGLEAPINRKIIELIQAAENQNRRAYEGHQLLALISDKV